MIKLIELTKLLDNIYSTNIYTSKDMICSTVNEYNITLI